MATLTTVLRAARKASAASRAAAAAASRAAAAASRLSRSSGVPAAGAGAARIAWGVNMWPTHSRFTSAVYDDAHSRFTSAVDDDAHSRFTSAIDYAHVADDAKNPTDKDFESDEALRSLYERWCKAFNKERDNRDHAEMDRRFKLFRYSAKYVHQWNSFVPEDKDEAAIFQDKRKEAAILLSKDEDVSHLDECYLPMELGAFADGGDPYFNEHDMILLKAIEERDAKGVMIFSS